MKAGIYRNPNTGQLLYVGGDRRVTAYTRRSDNSVHKSDPKHAAEFKVRSRNADAQVELEDGTLCDRVSDAPRPYVNDVALTKYLEANPTKLQRMVEDVQQRAFNQNGGDVSAEWKDGREGKSFSRQVVYGYGPGFLSEQMAAAERWLVQNTAQLDALVESGVLSRLHDEYTVLDADRYAAYLREQQAATPERFVGMPHTLGLGYGVDAIDKDGNAVVFKTGTSVGKTTQEQLDIYQRFARDIYGVTDADRERMRALGFRPCHKQSARKHRKAGHIVVGEGSGVYWWMKKAA